MGYPQYSLDDMSYVPLPGRSYGGKTNPSVVRRRVKHESDSGRFWARNLSAANPKRQVYEFTWDLLTVAEATLFETLDTAVDGDAVAFYWMFDSDNPSEKFYCRKEEHLDLQEVPSGFAGGTRRLKYTITLTEEFT